jgi:hypothetical protein
VHQVGKKDYYYTRMHSQQNVKKNIKCMVCTVGNLQASSLIECMV